MTKQVYQGHLRKMAISHDAEMADYQVRLDDQLIPINEKIGMPIKIENLGDIHCIECGRKSKKKFQSRVLLSVLFSITAMRYLHYES